MSEGASSMRSGWRAALWAPRSLVILLALHAIASWLFWLSRYEALRQETITWTMAAAGLLGTWGLLCIWLLGWTLVQATLAWLITGRDGWRQRPAGAFWLRAIEHVGVWLALLAASILMGLAIPSVQLMLWLFFALRDVHSVGGTKVCHLPTITRAL